MTETEAVYLTSEEKLSQLGDEIIAVLLHSESKTVAQGNAVSYRQKVIGDFQPCLFLNENYIIYKVIYDFKESNIIPDEDFMRMYLLRNTKLIYDSTEYININAYSELHENPANAYIIAVIKHFTRLKQKPMPSADEFDLILEKYKVAFQEVKMTDVLLKAQTMLTDGIKLGRKMQQGYDSTATYIKKGIAEIDSMLDRGQGDGFIDASVAGLSDDEGVFATKVGDFGLIKELNEHFGGIYAPYFYGITAPTKGGKSKFCTRLVHTAVCEYGTNVVVWGREDGWKAVLAQLRAIHYDWYYNRNEPDIQKHKRGVTQKRIQERNYPSESIRLLEEASRVDLFTNESYGNIQCVDRPFLYETLEAELETAIKLNNAKLIFIDYLQLVDTKIAGLTKTQAIGKSYQTLLAFCKKWNVAVIAPAQMTQDFMNEMARSNSSDSKEIRTAGGESAEVVRTPDINIALYGSIEDIRQGSMRLLSIPSRLANPFPAFDIYCDLSISQFASLE